MKLFYYSKTIGSEFNMDLKILVSQKAQINKRDYHTFSYDEKFECMNCNCAEYLSSDKKLSYDIILNFINLKDHNFCVIKNLLSRILISCIVFYQRFV